MKKITYPNLDGWETNPAVIADLILSDVFLSDKGQSQLFNDVVSMSYIVQNYASNITEMCNKMQNALTYYFERYFNNTESTNGEVSIEVSERPQSVDSSKAEINIYIKFVYDGNIYDYGRIVQLKDNKIQSVISLNNNQSSY